MKNEGIFAVFMQKKAISIKRTKEGVLCFKDGLSRKLSLTKVYQEYLSEKNTIPGWEYMDENDIQEYLIAHAPKDDQKEDRTPPSEFIKKWINAHSFEWDISPMAKRITLRRRNIPIDKDITDLESSMLVDIYDKKLPYRDGEISRGLKVYMMDRYHNGVANMFEGISYRQNSEGALDKWLGNLYDWLKPSEDREIFFMMWKHWGWQTKRKILGREVKYHNWINLYGASGLGKTTAIKKICKPMEDVTSTTTIAKLFDDTREVKRLTENYVLIFDELSINSEREEGDKLTGDQLGTVKSLITGDFLDTRVFKTQDQSKKKITFSCISSANQHLYDVIYDPETMRRFFEFHCQAKATGDFSMIEPTLNNSTYFWRGLDENLGNGYFDPDSVLGHKVASIQNHYYPTKSSVFDWIGECDVRAGSKPAWSAYKYYSQYCRNCGRKAKAMPTFISDIKHAIPDARRGETVMLDFTVTDLCRKLSYDDDDFNALPFKVEEPADPMKPQFSGMV